MNFRSHLAAAVIGVWLMVPARAQGPDALGKSDYAPAFFDPGGAFLNAQRLVVFPPGTAALAIPIPVELGYIAFSRDGNVLYGTRLRDPADGAASIYKVGLDPVRATPIPGADGLAPIYAIGASEKNIVVSGRYKKSGLPSTCGVFELTLATGALRKVIDNPDCTFVGAWQSISLSADGDRAVAVRKNKLALIDVATGVIKPIADGIFRAAWSPDGRWIAALEYGGGDRTFLIDASTLVKRRDLPSSEVIWSPDSRHLMAVDQSPRCNPDYGTLQQMDIETGTKSTIQNSTCMVDDSRIGWVRAGSQ